jgi:hypothetical protein
LAWLGARGQVGGREGHSPPGRSDGFSPEEGGLSLNHTRSSTSTPPVKAAKML